MPEQSSAPASRHSRADRCTTSPRGRSNKQGQTTFFRKPGGLSLFFDFVRPLNEAAKAPKGGELGKDLAEKLSQGRACRDRRQRIPVAGADVRRGGREVSRASRLHVHGQVDHVRR